MLTLAVPYFDRIEHNALFQKAMHGIVVSFVGLLLSVTLRFILTLPWAMPQVVFVLLAFLALRLKIDILWVVFIGGGLSALLL
jgi:chromate transporter